MVREVCENTADTDGGVGIYIRWNLMTEASRKCSSHEGKPGFCVR